jgi:hypothetical protein
MLPEVAYTLNRCYVEYRYRGYRATASVITAETLMNYLLLDVLQDSGKVKANCFDFLFACVSLIFASIGGEIYEGSWERVL